MECSPSARRLFHRPQSLQNLAVLYYEGRDQSRYEKAEQFFERALAIREQLLPPEHPQIARVLDSFGSFYEVQDKDEEAEKCLKRALEIRGKVLGADNDKVGNLPPILSMSAPSSEPDTRRANSADTYNFFFSHVQVPPGSSLLLITSQIYVPYQQLEALRIVALKHNVVIETVGFPLEWSGNLQGMTGPNNYLQEIRSTIQSANRFFSVFPKG